MKEVHLFAVIYRERHSDLVKHNCVPVQCDDASQDAKCSTALEDMTVDSFSLEDVELENKDRNEDNSDGSIDDMETDEEKNSENDDDGSYTKEDSDLDSDNGENNDINQIQTRQDFVHFHPISVLSKQQVSYCLNIKFSRTTFDFGEIVSLN